MPDSLLLRCDIYLLFFFGADKLIERGVARIDFFQLFIQCGFSM